MRDTMPPPLPTPAPPGGDCTCTPVCLRGGTDTSLSSGMGKGTGIAARYAWMQARLPPPTRRTEYLCYHYAVVLALFNAITLCFKQNDYFVHNPNILQT